MRRFLLFSACLMAICGVICSCGGGDARVRHDDGGESVEEPAAKVQYNVFSLYCNTGKSGYQIYKNGDKLALFDIGDSRRLLGMRVHGNDCYILVSESSADSVASPAEIYKNGHPAMRFEDDFHADGFDIENGHFYVMGHFGDTTTVVYKDGVRVSKWGYSAQRKPVGLAVSGQDVYVAFQLDGSVEVCKTHGNVLFSYPGNMVDFRVSRMGVYMLTERSMYRDKEPIMEHEYYRNADKEMFAAPRFFSLSNDNCYVGGQGTIDGTKSYACLYLNRQHSFTVKPDDKPLGASSCETRCAGVAISHEEAFMAVVKINEHGDTVQPLRYQYYFNTDESFKIDFSTRNAQLIYMESNSK